MLKRKYVLLPLIILEIALLSSCQIEKRHYVRGFFINKTACEFDSNKRAMDTRDTLMIPQASEIELLEQNEPMIVINSENILASANETGSDELCLQPFIKSQNEHFFNIEKRIAVKYQENTKDFFSSQRISNDEPIRIHPLILIGLLCGILCLIVAGLWFLFSDPAILGIALFSLSLISLLIGRSRVKKHPEKWSSNKLANILLVVLLVFGALFILFEIVLFIYMLFTVVY